MPHPLPRRRGATIVPVVALCLLACLPARSHAQTATPTTTVQVKGTVPAGITPAWNGGIQPMGRDSYYAAIDCGKQPGNPACVFWDRDLCRNPVWKLAMYTPYKSVAYEVWAAVSRKRPVPQPNYAEAQRTNVTVGVTPIAGRRERLTDVVLKRGSTTITPIAKSLSSNRVTYGLPAFAPASGPATLTLVGTATTVVCTIDATALRRMR